jgi:hypothetical protein
MGPAYGREDKRITLGGKFLLDQIMVEVHAFPFIDFRRAWIRKSLAFS